MQATSVAERVGLAAKLLLTVPEASVVLGLSRSVMYELMDAGEIRSVKIGRARRVPFVALEEFVAHRLAEYCPALSQKG